MNSSPLKLLDRARIERELGKRSLRDYLRMAWQIVEPATPFRAGWHLDAIADALEAVSRGEIRQLLINVPPRMTKSISVAVMWPTWEWTSKPSIRWVFSSYALQLSVRDSLKCRRLIESDWYQERWGDVYQLVSDQNVKAKFENSRTGFRMAASVDSGITGEGGERIVVDDPHNVREAESDLERDAVIEWWDQVMSTRLNDPRTGARVIVTQRVHEVDLAGHVLERGGWEHLCLPMEYEPKRQCVVRRTLGEGAVIEDRPDPRQVEGELLCSERVGPVEVEQYKKDLGSRGYAGQYQQRPSPAEGGMFKEHWWKLYSYEAMKAAGLRPVGIFVDSAFKDGVENDYSAAVPWGSLGGMYYVLDVWEARKEFPELIAQLRLMHAIWKVPLYIEDRASGQSAIQVLRRKDGEHPAVPVIAYIDQGNVSKIARAEAQTPYVEAGLVHLPEGATWVQRFIDQHKNFPTGVHDDLVDTTAMALAILTQRVEEVPVQSFRRTQRWQRVR